MLIFYSGLNSQYNSDQNMIVSSYINVHLCIIYVIYKVHLCTYNLNVFEIILFIPSIIYLLFFHINNFHIIIL